MKNRHIEWAWLTQAFLDDFVLIYPVYALMMQGSGIDAFQLSVLFALWSLSALLFEIPSGVIGDLVNRRNYVCIGSLIRATGYLVWLVWPSFGGFALGFMLWSLGSSTHSGTLQSLLHDALTEQGRESDFARIYGRGMAAQSIGVLLAMTIGGFVAETGYTWVLILSALAPIAASLAVWVGIAEPTRTFTEDARASGTRTEDRGSDPATRVTAAPAVQAAVTTLLTAFRTILASPRLAMVALMFIAFMGLSGVLDEYLGPLLEEAGIGSLGIIGVLYGLILGARAVGTSLAHRLRKLSLRNIGMISLAAYLLLLFGQIGPVWWLVVCCGTYFAAMGAVEVLLETNLQEEIEVHARATITSVAGAGLEVWGIGLFLLIGAIADESGWSSAIGWIAAVSVLISAALAYSAGPVAARKRS